ncbi:MAG: A24 family peptidase [Thiolinea sp.]
MSNLSIELVSGITLTIFLAFALYTDLTKHRIANKLVFCILISGLTIQFYASGFTGFLLGLSGIVAGFMIFLPFNILGGMRAGDLKLMAAVGAFLTTNTPIAAGLSLVAGAVYGLVILFWQQGFSEYYNRYTTMVLEYTSTGKMNYQQPANNSVAATSFPYATAITTGAILTLILFP